MRNDNFYTLRKLHGRIHEYFLYKKERRNFFKAYVKPIKKALRNNPNVAFLVLTPEHSNMGDHAIAVSEARLLNQLDIKYIEITGHQLSSFEHYKYLHIMNGHPIFINGGGNMGTLWFSAERMHRSIIQNNPDSPIFIMPNTIYYEDSDHGTTEFNRSIEIYNAHHNLHIFAREESSYRTMMQAYKNVTLIPDMVFALNECKTSSQRHGCLLCLRVDHEKTISDAELQTIQSQAASLFGPNVNHTDMVMGGSVPITHRNTALEEKYSEFRRAELVITDRLHGMIFCAITGTPCIVINSRSPKVSGCYEWIRNLEYIKFAEQPSDITQLYNSIPRHPHIYDNTPLLPYFEDLCAIISSVLHKSSLS